MLFIRRKWPDSIRAVGIHKISTASHLERDNTRVHGSQRHQELSSLTLQCPGGMRSALHDYVSLNEHTCRLSCSDNGNDGTELMLRELVHVWVCVSHKPGVGRRGARVQLAVNNTTTNLEPCKSFRTHIVGSVSQWWEVRTPTASIHGSQR